MELKQINEKVNQIITKMNYLNQKFEDHFLNDDEKILIDEVMVEKKQGNLISPSEVF